MVGFNVLSLPGPGWHQPHCLVRAPFSLQASQSACLARRLVSYMNCGHLSCLRCTSCHSRLQHSAIYLWPGVFLARVQHTTCLCRPLIPSSAAFFFFRLSSRTSPDAATAAPAITHAAATRAEPAGAGVRDFRSSDAPLFTPQELDADDPNHTEQSLRALIQQMKSREQRQLLYIQDLRAVASRAVESSRTPMTQPPAAAADDSCKLEVAARSAPSQAELDLAIAREREQELLVRLRANEERLSTQDVRISKLESQLHARAAEASSLAQDLQRVRMEGQEDRQRLQVAAASFLVCLILLILLRHHAQGRSAAFALLQGRCGWRVFR